MKKFFAQSFLFLTLLPLFTAGVFFIPKEVRAASVTGTCEWTATNKTTKTTRVVTQNSILQTGCKDQDTPTETWVVKSFTPTGTQQQTGSIDGKEDSASCINPLNWPTCFMSAIAATLLQFAALFTTVTGYLLNGVIYHTVVKVSDNYGNLTAILTTWQALRDIANMCFIFVLLYAAIQTILGEKGSSRQLIVNVIVVAALLNFSLFFTRVVIDMGNALALTFYDAINPGVAANGFDLGQAGISNAFMKHLNLSSLYNISNTVGGSGIIMTGLMGTIMLLVASFCFLAVSILFIIRYIVLILVMIFSPIAMIAYVLPSGTGVGAYQKQWMDALLGQTFFAPIYFLLTWVSLRVMGGFMSVLTDSTKAGDFEGTLSGIGVSQTLQSGAFMMFINFAVVIALLITSLILAAKWADQGGVGMSKWAKEKAGSLTFGMTQRFGRTSFGRIGSMLADTKALKDAEAKGGVRGMAARLALAGGRKAAGATFDIRGTSLGTKLGAGLAGKSFFDKTTNDVKKREERAKNLDTSISSSEVDEEMEKQGYGKAWRAGRSATEIEFERRRIQNQLTAQNKTENLRRQQEFMNTLSGSQGILGSQIGKGADREAALKLRQTKGALLQNLAKQEALEKKVGSATTETEFEDALRKASDKEVEAIVEANSKLLEKMEFANALSVKQLEALNKSDKFSDDQKDSLKAMRFKNINDAIALGGPLTDPVKKRIQSLTDTELEMIDSDHLINPEFVEALKPTQVDDINKNKAIGATRKKAFNEERSRPLREAFARGSWGEAGSIMKKAGELSLAKMSADYTNAPTEPQLDNPNILHIYTPSVLNKMAAQSDLNVGKRGAIRKAIEDKVAADPILRAKLAALVPARGRLRVTAAERAAALAGLSTEQKNLVTSAEWLDSENGQQLF